MFRQKQCIPIRMEVIRRSLADRGFSSEAIKIISVPHGSLGLIHSATQLGRNGVANVSIDNLIKHLLNEVVISCHNVMLKVKATVQSTHIGRHFLQPCTRSTLLLSVDTHSSQASQRNSPPQNTSSTLFIKLGC